MIRVALTAAISATVAICAWELSREWRPYLLYRLFSRGDRA